MQTVSDEVRRLSRLVRTMLDISPAPGPGVPEAKKSRFNISESLGRVLLSFEQKSMKSIWMCRSECRRRT